MAMPASTARGNWSRNSTREKNATHAGISATITAAIPDGMVCSPTPTNALPTATSPAPTMNMSRTWRAVGRSSAPRCRMSATTPRISPASANRVAAIRNGGIVSTTSAIPR